MLTFSQWTSCIVWYIFMCFCFTRSFKDVLERFTVLSDSRWAPPEEQKWPFCIGHHSNLCFPTFCFFKLSWRVLGRSWNALGLVFGCLGAVLGRIGAVFGKRSGEVLTPWSLLGRLLEAAWGLLLICRWFCMDFDSFWEGFWDSKWIKSEPLFQRICGIRFSMDLLLILNVFLEGFGNENRQPNRSKYWWTFQ